MRVSAYGPTVLRLALAAVFAAHGAQKLFGAWGGGGLPETAAFLSSLGLERPLASVAGADRASTFLAAVIGGLEFGGGLLLIPGVFTRWIAGALAVEMLIAAYKVHLPNGFFLNWTSAPGLGHGVEMSLVVIGGLVCLLFTGAGALSIDGWRRASEEEAALGRARVRSKLH